MKQTTRIAILVLSCFFIGCSAIYYPTTVQTGGAPEQHEERTQDQVMYSFADLGIPKGHLPPPGECKVWFPDRPAGHQPPPQSCSSAFRDRPLGAWVITHESNRYRVITFVKAGNGISERTRYYRNK